MLKSNHWKLVLPSTRVFCWLLVLGLFCAGCSQSDEPEDRDAANEVENVTDEDVKRIKNALVAAIADSNQARFVALFSKPYLFDLVFDDIKISTSLRRKLESNISRGGNIAAFASQVLSGQKMTGEYKFVTRIDSQKGSSLLFRFVTPKNNEIEYHRYEIFRGPQSKLRIRNVYFYLEQDSLAERLRQRVLLELRELGELESKSGVDLASQILVDQSQTNEFQKFLELITSESWQEAWAAYVNLPEPVRDSWQAVYQRLMVSAQLGDLYVETALKDARRIFPKHIRSEFFAYEYYRKQAAFQKMIEAVDRILAVVNDPYLKLLKLDAQIRTGQLEEARETIKQFAGNQEIDPARLILHEFELAVAEQDYPRGVKILQRLKDQYRLRFNNLEQLPRYADLVKSSEYKQWVSGSK